MIFFLVILILLENCHSLESTHWVQIHYITCYTFIQHNVLTKTTVGPFQDRWILVCLVHVYLSVYLKIQGRKFDPLLRTS